MELRAALQAEFLVRCIIEECKGVPFARDGAVDEIDSLEDIIQIPGSVIWTRQPSVLHPQQREASALEEVPLTLKMQKEWAALEFALEVIHDRNEGNKEFCTLGSGLLVEAELLERVEEGSGGLGGWDVHGGPG